MFLCVHFASNEMSLSQATEACLTKKDMYWSPTQTSLLICNYLDNQSSKFNSNLLLNSGDKKIKKKFSSIIFLTSFKQ